LPGIGISLEPKEHIMKIRNLFIALSSILLIAPALADNHGGYGKEHDHGKNIIETARDAGQFGTLLTAIEAAGLTDALSADGPFTVFAPTDDAFGAIPEDQLNALLADTDALTAVLTYHVVNGKLKAADLAELGSAETLQGSSVSISTYNGSVRIDGATVVTADIEASNGVIHVIDAVITP
jgi:uncharacterized surface protein with fasciclin (FAS1) repeats